MSDHNDNDTKDRDLPGFSSHFSTTLTGLKPMRRRSRATTSTEFPPDSAETSGTEEAAEPTTETSPAAPTEASPGDSPGAPTAMTSLEEVRDEAEPPVSEPHSDGSSPPMTATEAEDDQEEPSADDPLAGIELRPGLSLVDTAEIPIHRAEAAAKLAKVREPKRPSQSPPPPQRPVVRNRPPSQNRPTPPVLDVEASSARYRPQKRSSGGAGWAYVAVIILIACLIGALMMQVKDLL